MTISAQCFIQRKSEKDVKTITVFTPQDIEKLVIDSMSIKKYESITAVVEKETVGYGMAEQDVMVFKGYKVKY